jgi:microcin C transport system permease protein
MAAYLLKRLLLIIPTLFGIMLINFAIIQFAPGGPVEQVIAQLSGMNAGASNVGGGGGDGLGPSQPGALDQASGDTSSKYRGAQGLDPEFIKELEKQFGFDKPVHERFILMIKNYLTFDFGNSYFRDKPVLQLIKEKLPVSMTLGFSMLLISYFISIPLGIRKAVKDGSPFDVWTSGALVIGYALPGFMVGVFLLVFLAGGSFYQIFPIGKMSSDGADQLAMLPWILDRIWHITLPLFAMVLAAFTTLTFLTKNSFIDEIGKQYVLTARSKGLTENGVLYGHVFRNAMLIVIAGFPGAFVSAFFTSTLLIEVIFSLDGLGLLGFESVIKRDYPVVFATLFLFTLLGLVMHIITDFVYTLIDPRIDFESREV